MPDKNIQKSTFLNVRLDFLVCMFLVVAVLVAYWQIPSCGFVGFDDKPYVTENRQVQKGFTVEGLAWAFTTFHAANWHPLTWLSHMLDFQLYGLNPLGHHWTNLQLHIANTLLLFFILLQMTGMLWRSAFVAALFALHPLHVESVAWVAERKDVLSTFFGLLAIIAYYLYVRHKGLIYYLLVFLFLSLGLMAKPMLVTWPFLLLLLDFWPLNRLHFSRSGTRQVESITGFDSKIFFKLILEKIPLFIPVIFASIITFMAQQSRGAVDSLTSLPLDIRINNALVSWVSYVIKAVWPAHLTVFYPHPGNMLPIWQGVGAALLIAGSICAAVRLSRQYPYVIVGLFWYLGTLVPVIGLVQVGKQAMADRYTYIPLTGLFIVVAWGFSDLLLKWRYRKIFLAVLAAIILSALTVRTFLQVGYWQNAVTLFENAIKVTPDDPSAQNNLGAALYDDGRFDEAMVYFKKAILIAPEYTEVLSNLGAAYYKQGNYDKAVLYFEKALKNQKKDANAYDKLGVVLVAQGKVEEATAYFIKAIQINPEYANAHSNLANVLSRQGKYEEAELHYLEAIKLDTEHTDANYNLGSLLLRQKRYKEALIHLVETIRISPDNAEAYHKIGVVLAQQGKLQGARKFLKMAIQIDPNNIQVRKDLEVLNRKILPEIELQ
ncbi:MAG: tetratricopeptide repeat protein [Desulfobacteraceae bacterium]|nr:tetratricopeptide repeat protein [Desulfobacteraceae bacterium]